MKRVSLLITLVLFWVTPTVGADAERHMIVTQLENGSLHFVESASLKAPLHHAGYYVKWVNEQRFLSEQKLSPNIRYLIESKLVRSEVQQFPAGWKERSGRYYTTYYLEALSVKPPDNNAMEPTIAVENLK